MIWANLEFHNVAELADAPGGLGKLLFRYPASVRYAINPRGKFVSGESTGCEIRFVTDAPNLRVYLSAVKTEAGGDLAFRVFRGDFEVNGLNLAAIAPGVVNTLCLTPPERFADVTSGTLRCGRFAPEVWRIVFARGASAVFCGLESFGAPVRPPRPEEKPNLRYLAYGSSITHSNLDGYPLVAARRLGADVCNLGLSGACHAEPEMADYLAGRDDWDILTLEIGINILGMDSAEYEKRVDYLLSAIRGRHSSKPIAVITVFPCHASFQTTPSENFHAFNAILRRLAEKYNAALIEGAELLDDPTCLSTDLVHPGVFGHAVMGLNLAEKLRALI